MCVYVHRCFAGWKIIYAPINASTFSYSQSFISCFYYGSSCSLWRTMYTCTTLQQNFTKVQVKSDSKALSSLLVVFLTSALFRDLLQWSLQMFNSSLLNAKIFTLLEIFRKSISLWMLLRIWTYQSGTCNLESKSNTLNFDFTNQVIKEVFDWNFSFLIYKKKPQFFLIVIFPVNLPPTLPIPNPKFLMTTTKKKKCLPLLFFSHLSALDLFPQLPPEQIDKVCRSLQVRLMLHFHCRVQNQCGRSQPLSA